MAGGLITTRAASESNLGEDVAEQLLARPRPLAAAAGLLTALSLIPGLPKLAFLVIAGVFAFAAYAVRSLPEVAPEAPPPNPDVQEPVTGVDPLSVEVGYALVSLVDEKQGGTLLSRVRTIRRQIAGETGIVVPPVRVADNLQLAPRRYRILVKGVEAASGELYPERLLAINPGTGTALLEGVQTREPAFGLPATWITTDQRDSAAASGRTVVDATSALATHLSEVVRTFLPDLVTRQQVKEMVDVVGQTAPKLVEELVPKLVSIGDIQRVLRQLLRERVPVRDLASILEAIADSAAVSKDLDAMTEGVRVALGRAICRQYQNDKGELTVIAVAPSLEDRLLSSVVRTEQGAVLALDPQQAQSIASRIAKALEQALAQPVLLCSPTLRPHLWRLFARVLPHLGVLSHNEVPPQTAVVSVATLD
jgi:flagellar biosynthesis protein FlhA